MIRYLSLFAFIFGIGFFFIDTLTVSAATNKDELRVVKIGTGSGKVVSNPIGVINCGTGVDCYEIVDRGTKVTLTATADAGSSFVGWFEYGGKCDGTDPCVISVDGSVSITASFVKNSENHCSQYSLRNAEPCIGDSAGLSSDAMSTVVSTCSAPTGSVPKCEFYCKEGYVKSGNTCISCSGGNCDFRISVSKSGGEGNVISGGGGARDINCGSICSAVFTISGGDITLMANPASGFAFDYWVGCDNIGQSGPYDKWMIGSPPCQVYRGNRDKEITAVFKKGTETPPATQMCTQQGGICTATAACTGTQLGQYDCVSGQTCCKGGGGGGGGSGTIKIDGSCGNAARNYKVGETQFVGSFCYTGVPDILQNGSQIAFPKKESPSSWTCLGMSGGKSSPLCKATYDSATPPNSCSVYTSVSQVPAGYGSPFNELSTLKEPTLSVTCSANGAAVTAGNSANSSVYKSGFYTENGQWKKMSLTGLEDPNNTGWFKGTALSNIPTPSGQNFTIAFICQYQNNAWKCGCRDSACAQNYWTIQSYKP